MHIDFGLVDVLDEDEEVVFIAYDVPAVPAVGDVATLHHGKALGLWKIESLRWDFYVVPEAAVVGSRLVDRKGGAARQSDPPMPGGGHVMVYATGRRMGP